MVTEVLFEYRRGGCDRSVSGNSLSLSVNFDDLFFISTWLLMTGFFLLWNIINGLQYLDTDTHQNFNIAVPDFPPPLSLAPPSPNP